MSFGWSVGDIVKAIETIVKVSKGLKESSGASSQYRDSVAFLDGLNITTSRLKEYLQSTPADNNDLREQIEILKGPVAKFENKVKRFETSLDKKPKSFRDALRKTPRKVQWTLLLDSIIELRDAISGPQHVLNTLLHVRLLETTDALTATLARVDVAVSRSLPTQIENIQTNLSSMSGPASVLQKPVFMVPFLRDSDFVGREDVIANLDVIFASSDRRRAALVGLGGVGKSQIAIEYSYRLRDRSPGTWIFWVHASNITRFEQDYRNIANTLNLPGREEPNVDTLLLVSTWLKCKENGPWLMLIDNADEHDVFFHSPNDRLSPDKSSANVTKSLSALLPQASHGLYLITSRSRTLAHKLVGTERSMIDIQPMDEETSLDMLRLKVAEHQWHSHDARDLVRALERFPLAISQAGAYINSRATRLTISKYLDLFECELYQVRLLEEDSGDLRRDSSVPNAVLATWQISFDKLKRENAHAAELLSLMSVLDRQSVPEHLLIHEFKDDLAFEDALGSLIDLSLVETRVDGVSFSMHRLVQLSMKRWLGLRYELDVWTERALALVLEEFSEDMTGYPAKYEILLPHAQVIRDYVYTDEGPRLDQARLLGDMSWYLVQCGKRLDEALRLNEEAFQIQSELKGVEDGRSLELLGLKSRILDRQGNLKESEILAKQVVEMHERVLGTMKLQTLVQTSNLGKILQRQGRNNEVERLYLKVIATLDTLAAKGLLDEMESTEVSRLKSQCIRNLGTHYYSQGRLTEAEELWLPALRSNMSNLGAEHCQTLASMYDLAMLYWRQGNLKDARDINRVLLETRRRVLGDNHHDTLYAWSQKLLILVDEENLGEAEQLGSQILRRSQEARGPVHPKTMNCMFHLSIVYSRQGRFKEAEELKLQVSYIRNQVLGESNVDALMVEVELARFYFQHQRLEEAEKLCLQAIKRLEKVLGEGCMNTLMSQHLMVLIYMKQGRFKEAEHLCRQVIEESTSLLSEEHLVSLMSKKSMAEIYMKQERLEEAEQLCLKVVAGTTRSQGEHHYETLQSHDLLAQIRKTQSESAKQTQTAMPEDEDILKNKHVLSIDIREIQSPEELRV